jgi:isoleucyl-tRNA synthetase
MFPFLADTPNAFRVLGAEFVTTEDGTGVVHMAPGFGEDDQNACNAAGIPTICPMDEHGQYTAEITPWAGRHVFDANPDVIKTLKDAGVVVRHDSYNHSYPHCWRCAEPLVYRAVSSWFVKVTAFRDRMVELNDQITWVPDHLKEGSFGKWIGNARDWAISRNRFWGSPIPVWRSDNPDHPRIDVYGSYEEISRDFGVDVVDLHRPFVDELVRPNPDDPTGKSMMRRVPEVLDCWFESGSMPFAQVHYPFENREWFESHYPGDFIVEYIGQTRGWFYTLHVLATALFDRPAFSSCVSHGIVLGDDGAKMSKSLRNYPDPMKVFDTYGADAMRWYLMSSPILRGGDFSVTEQGIRDTVRQVLLPVWNSWYFLSLYANAAGTSGRVRTDTTNVLDTYVLAKLRATVESTTSSLDAYDLFGASQTLRSFLDVLTNWYIRRSRDRFWAGDQDAIDTLHTVLDVLVKAAAPLLPLVADEVHRGLNGDGAASVHLADWPDVSGLPKDDALVNAMDLARDVCSSALSVRKAHSRRVRLPLSSLTVAAPTASDLERFADILRDEVNVRNVVLTADVAAVASHELQVVPAVLGPRLGGRTQQIIKAVKAGEWTQSGDVIEVAGDTLQPGEFTLKLVTSADTASATLPGGVGVVLLDVNVTPELEAEGMARDLIRAVQQARRDAGLDVSDRIVLTLGADSSVRTQVEPHIPMVSEETLAVQVTWDDSADRSVEIEGAHVHVSVTAVR